MDNEDAVILLKFLRRECTDEELKKLNSWLEDPQNEQRVRMLMEQYWDTMKVEDTDTDIDLNQMLHSLRSRILSDKHPVMKVTRSRGNGRIWLRAAAVFVFTILSASIFLLVRNINNDPGKNLSFDYDIKSVDEYKKLQSSENQVTVKILPDGTRVKLNSNSKLIYGQDFGRYGSREVILDGEAFFDVTKDASRPFIVHTSDISIRVLGTSFNVKSYSQHKTIETTLIHGKVCIERKGNDNDKDRLLLNPNQTAIYKKAQNELMVEQMTVNPVNDWRYSQLAFDEMPVHIFLQHLEERYNVTIRAELQDTCNITAAIRDESLEQMLNLLVELEGITYSISGNEVFVKGGLNKSEDEI